MKKLIALLLVLHAGLLAALYSGLLVYSLVHMTAPKLSSHLSNQTARLVCVAGLGSLIVLLLILMLLLLMLLLLQFVTSLLSNTLSILYPEMQSLLDLLILVDIMILKKVLLLYLI